MSYFLFEDMAGLDMEQTREKKLSLDSLVFVDFNAFLIKMRPEIFKKGERMNMAHETTSLFQELLNVFKPTKLCLPSSILLGGLYLFFKNGGRQCPLNQVPALLLSSLNISLYHYLQSIDTLFVRELQDIVSLTMKHSKLANYERAVFCFQAIQSRLKGLALSEGERITLKLYNSNINALTKVRHVEYCSAMAATLILNEQFSQYSLQTLLSCALCAVSCAFPHEDRLIFSISSTQKTILLGLNGLITKESRSKYYKEDIYGKSTPVEFFKMYEDVIHLYTCADKITFF
jgi:hypothetical protein